MHLRIIFLTRKILHINNTLFLYCYFSASPLHSNIKFSASGRSALNFTQLPDPSSSSFPKFSDQGRILRETSGTYRPQYIATERKEKISLLAARLIKKRASVKTECNLYWWQSNCLGMKIFPAIRPAAYVMFYISPSRTCRLLTDKRKWMGMELKKVSMKKGQSFVCVLSLSQFETD